MVSHDRAFLERTALDVLQIDPHTREVKLYGGGYQAYREELERDKARAAEAYETYAATRDELMERARRQKEWARGGERTAKSAATRRKEPDKTIRRGMVEGAQRQAARGAATLRAIERLEPVAEPRKEWELRLRFGAATRSGEIVAVLSDAVIRRGSFQLGPVTLQLNWGDRMLVLGDNGSGKTTLLQALLGRLPLAQGRQSLGASVRIGEIDQRRLTFEPHQRLLDAFRAASGLAEAEARTLLAKFGLGADDIGRPVAMLSPGERTRADLALLMHAGANLLVLDEPTNHLDLPAIEQLEQALDRYDGTLLVVTHDRALAAATAGHAATAGARWRRHRKLSCARPAWRCPAHHIALRYGQSVACRYRRRRGRIPRRGRGRPLRRSVRGTAGPGRDSRPRRPVEPGRAQDRRPGPAQLAE